MSLFGPSIDRSAIALEDGRVTRSFGELEARVAAWVARFHGELGLAPGDHLALHLKNRVEYVEIVLAAIAGGLWITPVNWHLAPLEIAHVLADSGAKAVLVDGTTAGALPEDGPARVDIDALEPSAGSVPGLDLSAAPGGTMIYTSGTSGRPKGVKRAPAASVGAALEAMREGGRRFGLDGDGPHLVTGPMYHAAPLLFAIYDLLNGARVVIMRRWDEREALALMRAHRVRHAHFVPTMFVRLMRLPPEERAAFDPASLSLVLHGAAPITSRLKREMIAWWGPVLTEYWGATEGGIYTMVSSGEWLAREGTVGRPVSTFEIFAVGESGERLGADALGTLYCRHLAAPRPFEYHRDEEKTRSAYLEPHVFTAFDLGHVDDEGYVFLSARRSNLILRGGVNIYPAEVERAIAEHDAVADAVVYGVPDEEWGEQVHALVELAPGVDPSPELAEAILGFAATRLARFKVPAKLGFAPTIPRSEAGKLRREDLARLVASSR